MIVSYQRELERLYRIRDIGVSKYGRDHISWDSKLDWKTRIQELGVPVATTLQVQDELDHLTDPEKSFVLKPERGAANRGVFPCRLTEDGYVCDFFGGVFSFEEILGKAKKATLVKGCWFIEQYLGKVDNWEIYCFDGEVGLIKQRSQVYGSGSEGRFRKFYLPDWTPLGKIVENANIDVTLKPPINPEELLDVARKISENIEFTFARIDLYDGPDGVFFGEVTMHPGDPVVFTGEIDKMLGRLWLEAKARRGEE